MKTEIKDYYSLEDYNELHKILDHDVPLSFNDQFHKIDRYRHIFRVYYANYFDHEGNPELTRQLVNTVFHYGHKVNKLGSLYLMSTLSKLANKYGVDYNGSELLHILFKNNKKVFDEDYCKVFGILINAQQYEFNEKRFITKFNDYLYNNYSSNMLDFDHFLIDCGERDLTDKNGIKYYYLFKNIVAYCYYKNVKKEFIAELFRIYKAHFHEISEYCLLNGYFDKTSAITEEYYKSLIDYFLSFKDKRKVYEIKNKIEIR